MKTYTDIEQSKKLAEILPLESADMSWTSNGLGKPFARTIPIKGHPEEICPCWSLAALLEHLREIDLFPEIKDSDDYILMDMYIYVEEEGKVLHPVQFIRARRKTILDACYEMIVKLKEQNLL